MKQQWTTVTDSVKKASHDAGHIMSLSPDDARKNRRIALALASTGVFLILVGATPFVFNGGDSSDYAAFLGQDLDYLDVNSMDGEEVGIPLDDFGDEVIDLSADPVEVDVEDLGGAPAATDDFELPAPPAGGVPSMDGSSGSPTPIPTETPMAISPTPLMTETPTPFPTLAQTPVPTAVATPVYSAAPEYEDDFRDEIPSGDDEIITETVDFPVNIHVDGSAEPVDYSVVVGEEFHMAAPNQPKSGIPALPLLAFSGAAAAWIRSKRRKQR